MNSNVIPLKRERITNLLIKVEDYKIVYVSANIGSGKTFEVQMLQEKMQRRFIWYAIQKQDNENKYFVDNIDSKIDKKSNKLQIVVIDNLYLLQGEERRKKLVQYIETTPKNIHFIICTRNVLTPEYRKFLVDRELLLITTKELQFTKEDIKKLFSNNNIEIKDEEIENIIIKRTYGYAIGIIYLLSKILDNNKINKELLEETEHEMFEYIQFTILDKLDNIHRRFLIKISLLEEITIETSTIVTGNLNSKNMLEDLMNYGSFLINKRNKYILNEFLRKVLKNEMEEKFSTEEINELYNNIASYYEKENKILESVKYYIIAQEYEQAALLLEKESKKNIAVTSYKDIEKYIRKLPENVIIKHSSLCSNLCIMYSIKYKLKEANMWYEKLKQMKKQLPNNSIAMREMDENILYAKIALPNTTDINLVTDLKILFRVIGNRNKISQKFTMTGNQPTLISGSKDFCNWSNHYKILYILMKPIIEKLFEDSAIGIADIGVGEVLYQRNNLEEAYIHIVKGIGDAERDGIIDTLFVGYSLYSKIEFDRGNIQESKRLIKEIGDKINKNKAEHLIANYNALVTRFNIQERNLEKTKKWLQEINVDIKNKFNTLDRYQYLTQIRAYIALEQYKNALLTLDILFPYIETFNRTFNKIEYYILKAITIDKLSNNKKLAYENLEQALLIGQKYGFIRIFIEETYNLKNILEEYKKVKSNLIKEEYLNNILKEMNVFYDIHYSNKQKNNLTNAELEVIKLIEIGFTNDEIAQKLCVSKATVKTHINHIYTKLNVNNRTKAINKLKNIL